ncbi:hypothetical protein [Novosphingobium sp. M1R2S20]|uniref:Transcriptional regulator n=1 Tax=Novosphingobium rhizovicinum TaxID=3228928 RepID=A0ABV3RCM3_9SPHN
MALKTSSESEPPQAEAVIDMAELGARLSARRAELGCASEMPRNAGNRRTASKRALLAAIEATGAKW